MQFSTAVSMSVPIGDAPAVVFHGSNVNFTPFGQFAFEHDDIENFRPSFYVGSGRIKWGGIKP